MKRICVSILLVLMSSCASVTEIDSSVKIFNVSQGLARIESNGEGIIYAEGSNFMHQVNGSCVADGKTTPCMWFAVAFEFEANTDLTQLTCKATFSEPTDVVTPKEVIAIKASEDTETVELRGRKGKVFWPGYSIADGKIEPHNTTVTCEHKGKSVLSYSFTFTEQPNSKAENRRIAH